MPLGRQYQETHLYHATKPPVICYTPDEVAKAKEDGYSETYIPQKYPKAMYKDTIQIAVKSAAEEADFAKLGYKPAAGVA